MTGLNNEDLVYRLRKRAEIRRQIPGRKSVEEGKPDRIADILEEAADYIDKREWVGLTEQERNDLEDYCEMIVGKAAFTAIEAKLKEKNI